MSKLLKDALLFLVDRGDDKFYNCHQTQYHMRKNCNVDYEVGELLNVNTLKLLSWRKSMFLDCAHNVNSSLFIKSFPRQDIWRAYD